MLIYTHMRGRSFNLVCEWLKTSTDAGFIPAFTLVFFQFWQHFCGDDLVFQLCEGNSDLPPPWESPSTSFWSRRFKVTTYSCKPAYQKNLFFILVNTCNVPYIWAGVGEWMSDVLHNLRLSQLLYPSLVNPCDSHDHSLLKVNRINHDKQKGGHKYILKASM